MLSFRKTITKSQQDECRLLSLARQSLIHNVWEWRMKRFYALMLMTWLAGCAGEHHVDLSCIQIVVHGGASLHRYSIGDAPIGTNRLDVILRHALQRYPDSYVILNAHDEQSMPALIDAIPIIRSIGFDKIVIRLKE